MTMSDSDRASVPLVSQSSHPEGGVPQLPPHPLDGRWHLHIDGQSYGPYTGHQIKDFIREGRVAGTTSVMREGGTSWTQAQQDQALAPLFSQQTLPAAPPPVTAEKGATVVQVTNTFSNPQPHLHLLEDAGPAGLKSPGIALLLSLLICGVGQMYNGQVAKGILMLIGSLFLWFIFLGWIVWIWSMIDAYSTAKAMSLRFHRRLAAGYPV